ncbi:DUF397 domain-containing protein [Nocardiopsis sp. RSe5-2]|uniref:DUF397 domain-containing protein n=1 Tax=Nocardiopsis endophytica TaxID=3018445 RepID=A0ABT4U3L6_9ACTN|nr:DUF397 domain-containing protein [Nocardiopsis endophytica]MDA2811525.1 DUF397 domain-containing protein [Nocardiopsis endophytica]
MTELRNGWRKSSYSQGKTTCVEVAESSSRVLVRDTRYRELGYVSFPRVEWMSLLQELKRGGL